MTLKVVGSGLGRTGTKSLQSALNILGLGPCHHMVEVFAHPESRALWIDAAAGRPDWDAIFAGYQSVVDYPGARYWREIAAHYPHAKVLHSVRDPDQWFEIHPGDDFRAQRACRQSRAPLGILRHHPGGFRRSSARPRFHDGPFPPSYRGRYRRHPTGAIAALPGGRRLGAALRVPRGPGPGCALPVGKFPHRIHRPGAKPQPSALRAKKHAPTWPKPDRGIFVWSARRKDYSSFL